MAGFNKTVVEFRVCMGNYTLIFCVDENIYPYRNLDAGLDDICE